MSVSMARLETTEAVIPTHFSMNTQNTSRNGYPTENRCSFTLIIRQVTLLIIAKHLSLSFQTERLSFTIVLTYSRLTFFASTLGSKPVTTPRSGRKAQTLKTKAILVWSARFPRTADPKPPRPKAKPKNKPAIVPTFPGTRSVAYTRIAENAEAMITPMITARTTVQKRFA